MRIEYKKLSPEELKKNSRWKYELTKTYFHREDDIGGVYLGKKSVRIKGYIYYDAKRHILHIYKGYRWDGSSVVPDTIHCMRASLVHDAIYQLMREELIEQHYRRFADLLYRKICLEDGPKFFLWKVLWRGIVEVRYVGIRIGAGYAAKPKKKAA